MTQQHAAHDAPRHGPQHGSRRDYLIGFVLSVVLTALPFWAVMAGPWPFGPTAALITACAVVQVVVHVRYFLHITGQGDDGWALVSFVFTAIIVVITIGGSIWAMYQMGANMMPMPADPAMPMP